MSAAVRHPPSAGRGMVLVAVLWIVAALAILVSGMSRTLRGEARLAASARQQLQAAALGDAAIHLALQALAASAQPPARLTLLPTRYQGQAIEVLILPLNGLIDLNAAPQPLLARLLVLAAGLDAGRAEALAKAATDWRALRPGGGGAQGSGSGGAQRGFEAVEDLLRVPGIDYALYARIAPLVTAELEGSGRVNPLAAPEAVLALLANGDAAQAARIAAERSAGGVAIDTTGLTADFIDGAAAQRFRLEARVALPDGGQAWVSRSVELLAGPSEQEGLPWRSFRTERRLAPPT